MDKATLQGIIVSQKEKFLSKEYLIERNIVVKEEKKLLAREVVFITGVRRSGKSSLLYLTYQYLNTTSIIPTSNVLFVNFEDERFTNFSVNDFEKLFQAYLELENPKGKMYFFFDEIQNIKNWERWINRLYEFEDVKIFITGSNASLINSDIATALTGRNRQIQNYPFSFNEYTVLKKKEFSKKALLSDRKKVEINRLLNKYFETGGFPEALKTDDVGIVDQYFKDIIYRDVIAKYGIRNVKEIKELALYLITNTGAVNSYENLKKIIGATNTSTIKNYLEIFQDVYLVYALPMYHFSIKKQIYNPNKYYVVDIGFYHAVGFSFSPDYEKLLENLVLHELLRHEYDVYYWLSKNGKEIDFVVQYKKQITMAIQVCYNLTNENRDRELRSLVAASQEIEAQELFVITKEQDFEVTYEEHAIKVVSLLNWFISFN